MMNFIRRKMFLRGYQRQIKADQQAVKVAREVVRVYGWRGTRYDILEEVKQMLEDKV